MYIHTYLYVLVIVICLDVNEVADCLHAESTINLNTSGMHVHPYVCVFNINNICI